MLVYVDGRSTCLIANSLVDCPELVHPVSVDIDEKVPGQEHTDGQVEEGEVHQVVLVLHRPLHAVLQKR